MGLTGAQFERTERVASFEREALLDDFANPVLAHAYLKALLKQLLSDMSSTKKRSARDVLLQHDRYHGPLSRCFASFHVEIHRK